MRVLQERKVSGRLSGRYPAPGRPDYSGAGDTGGVDEGISIVSIPHQREAISEIGIVTAPRKYAQRAGSVDIAGPRQAIGRPRRRAAGVSVSEETQRPVSA